MPATVINPTAGAAHQVSSVSGGAQAPVVVQAVDIDMDRTAPVVDLTSALAGANLSQYEDALRQYGVNSVEDIQDLQEADCIELGMKKLEAKRMMRLGPETV